MEKYLVVLNGKIIKTYVRKSFAVLKFNKLSKTIDPYSDSLAVLHHGLLIMSTGK